MNPIVSQIRAGIKAMILTNPTRFYYFENNTIKYLTARKAHEQGSVSSNGVTPVGLGTSFGMYIFTEHNTAITENMVLCESGQGWKVGAVDLHTKFGEIYERRAKLTLVSLSANCAITSFKIGAAVGTINQTLGTIAITVPSGTDVTALNPTIVHNGKMIDKTGVQNFTTPVEYTITAENLATKKYTVTAGVAP